MLQNLFNTLGAINDSSTERWSKETGKEKSAQSTSISEVKALGNQIVPTLTRVINLLSEEKYSDMRTHCETVREIITNSPFALDVDEQKNVEECVQELLEIRGKLLGFDAALSDLRADLSNFLI